MPKCRLQDRTIKAASVTATDKDGADRTYKLPPAAGSLDLWDDLLPGFGLRINAGGKRVFTVMTRLNGQQIRRTAPAANFKGIGEAREWGRKVIADASTGIDAEGKAAKRKAAAEARREAERAEVSTFRAVAEAWLADDGKGGAGKLRSREHVRGLLERAVFPTWGSRAVGDITQDDVFDLVDGIARKHPTQANRTLAHVRRIFAWAAARPRRWVDASPAAGVERPAEETSRDRVLSDDELRRIWGAAEGLGFPFGPVVKLLILTGQRRGEVGGMKWAELDLEGDNPQWLIPGSRTKNGRDHIVPLSPLTRDILRAVPRIEGCDHVFASGRAHKRDADGKRIIDRPVSGWGTPKGRIDRVLEKANTPIEDWRLHDFRRTMVTAMNETLGIDPHVVEAVVNHASGSATSGVAGVYNRAQYLAQRRVALAAWAKLVGTIAGLPVAAENVASLDERRRVTA